MTFLNSQDEVSGPISTRRHIFLIILVAAAVISAFIFPMSWQLFVIYISVGVVIGLLGTLDELPKFLGFIILVLVAYLGPDWMAAIAPHWHSTRSEPGIVVLGAMAAVALAYVHSERSARGRRRTLPLKDWALMKNMLLLVSLAVLALPTGKLNAQSCMLADTASVRIIATIRGIVTGTAKAAQSRAMLHAISLALPGTPPGFPSLSRALFRKLHVAPLRKSCTAAVDMAGGDQ
jgi:hypothetical protein